MSGEEDAPVLVLDTNVLISGLLNPPEVPATILRMAVAGKVKLAYDARILAEYRDVVRRLRCKLDLRLTEEILDALVAEGTRVTSTSCAGGPEVDHAQCWLPSGRRQSELQSVDGHHSTRSCA